MCTILLHLTHGNDNYITPYKLHEHLLSYHIGIPCGFFMSSAALLHYNIVLLKISIHTCTNVYFQDIENIDPYLRLLSKYYNILVILLEGFKFPLRFLAGMTVAMCVVYQVSIKS